MTEMPRMTRPVAVRRRAPIGAVRSGPPTRRDGKPDPVRLVRAIAQVFLEVEAGRRPLSQLAPVLAPALLCRLQALGRPARPGGHRCAPGPAAGVILSCRAVQPTPDACDVAVVVRRGERVAALAVRVERHRGAWRAVEIARPEDGGTPTPTSSLPWAPPARDVFDELAGLDPRPPAPIT